MLWAVTLGFGNHSSWTFSLNFMSDMQVLAHACYSIHKVERNSESWEAVNLHKTGPYSMKIAVCSSAQFWSSAGPVDAQQ